MKIALKTIYGIIFVLIWSVVGYIREVSERVMHTCETCKYRNPYRDATIQDDRCGGCCSWNDKWEPTEPEEVSEE